MFTKVTNYCFGQCSPVTYTRRHDPRWSVCAPTTESVAESLAEFVLVIIMQSIIITLMLVMLLLEMCRITHCFVSAESARFINIFHVYLSNITRWDSTRLLLCHCTILVAAIYKDLAIAGKFLRAISRPTHYGNSDSPGLGLIKQW